MKQKVVIGTEDISNRVISLNIHKNEAWFDLPSPNEANIVVDNTDNKYQEVDLPITEETPKEVEHSEEADFDGTYTNTYYDNGVKLVVATGSKVEDEITTEDDFNAGTLSGVKVNSDGSVELSSSPDHYWTYDDGSTGNWTNGVQIRSTGGIENSKCLRISGAITGIWNENQTPSGDTSTLEFYIWTPSGICRKMYIHDNVTKNYSDIAKSYATIGFGYKANSDHEIDATDKLTYWDPDKGWWGGYRVLCSLETDKWVLMKIRNVPGQQKIQIEYNGQQYEIKSNKINATGTDAPIRKLIMKSDQRFWQNVDIFFDNFRVRGKYTNGTWTSTSYDLSPVGTVKKSYIEWDAEVPDGASLTIETSIDGGSTWDTATNGGEIPGLSEGTDVSSKSLLIKATLTSTDNVNTPVLSRIYFYVTPVISTNGSYESNEVDLSLSGKKLLYSGVSWSSIEPADTNIEVQTKISLDGGATWTNCVSATNGGSIPGLSFNDDISNLKLKYKLNFNSTGYESPIFKSIKFLVMPPSNNQIIVDVDNVRQFTGYIDSNRLDLRTGQFNIRAMDFWKKFERRRCQNTVYINAAFDTVLKDLIQQGGENVSNIIVESTGLTIAFLHVTEDDHVSDILNKLVQSVGGSIYYDENGRLIFKAGFKSAETTTVVDTITISDISELQLRGQKKYNLVRVVVKKPVLSEEVLPVYVGATEDRPFKVPAAGYPEDSNDEFWVEFEKPVWKLLPYSWVILESSTTSSNLYLDETTFIDNFYDYDQGILKNPNKIKLKIVNLSGSEQMIYDFKIFGKFVEEEELEVLEGPGTDISEAFEVQSNIISDDTWAQDLAAYLYDKKQGYTLIEVKLSLDKVLNWHIKDKIGVYETNTGLTHRCRVVKIDMNVNSYSANVVLEREAVIT
ncbi:MAG: hypothetical protein ACP6IS_12435 [Candidatus Asgardarchaeia archaeon]